MNKDGTRFYKPQDRKDVFKLYEDIKGPDRLEEFKKLWDWKYLKAPYLIDNQQLALVSEEEGSLVGFMAAMPVPLKIGDQAITAVWPTDLMVNSKIPSNMWSSKLIRYLAVNTACCLATPNRNSFPISIRVGYKHVCDIPTFINITKPSSFGPKFLKLLITPFDYLWRGYFKLGSLKKTKLVVEEANSFGDWTDRLFERISPQFSVIAKRDKNMLNWRFVDSPFKYNILVAKDKGCISGYVVLRLKKDNQGFKRGCLVDFFAGKENKDVINVLIKESVKFFYLNKVDAISAILLPFIELEKALKKHGFIFKKYNQRLNVFSREHLGQLTKKENWYLTQFDSDLDML